MKLLAPKLIPVAIASILCGVAVAGGGKDHMSMMDKNGDGKVTAVEHRNATTETFAKMDANKDGGVTATEMDAAHSMKAQDHETARTDDRSYDKSADKAGKMTSAQKIASMDTDKNGSLSGEEYAAGAQKMFSKMDKDGDGALTAQEVREGERSALSASDE